MIKIVKGHIRFHYFFDKNLAVYFNSFGIEYISQEVLNKIKDNRNIFRIQFYSNTNLLCVDFIVSLSLNTCLQEKLG